MLIVFGIIVSFPFVRYPKRFYKNKTPEIPEQNIASFLLFVEFTKIKIIAKPFYVSTRYINNLQRTNRYILFSKTGCGCTGTEIILSPGAGASNFWVTLNHVGFIDADMRINSVCVYANQIAVLLYISSWTCSRNSLIIIIYCYRGVWKNPK